MKNNIRFVIRVYTKEVDDFSSPMEYTTLAQSIEINENQPFDTQVQTSKDLLERVMKNLKEQYEK